MLFPLPPVDKLTKTCRYCKHRERWQSGGRVIQYCGLLKSNRTENGLKKIKVTDKACMYYETD